MNTETKLSRHIYADDMLIFLKADIQNPKAIKDIFKKLHRITGLQMNTEKTCIFLVKNAILNLKYAVFWTLKRDNFLLKIWAYHCLARISPTRTTKNS